MSFLDNMKTDYESWQSPSEQLAATAKLLDDLKAAQDERLAKPPPQHFAHMPKAGEKELELAAKVT